MFQPFKILVCILILTIVSDTTASTNYRIHERDIPPEHEKAFEFLELIKWPQEPKDGFNAMNAPSWDLSKLMYYISRNGITFSDVNSRLVGSFSKDQIKAQLSERKGDIFQSFAHLSHIYSIPYKQYSELHFEGVKNGVIINIGGWYRLTFQYVDGNPYLIKLDYEELEGD